MIFKVQYFYHAQGMAAEIHIYEVEAETGEEAIEKIVLKEYPVDIPYGPGNKCSSRDFLRDCLSII